MAIIILQIPVVKTVVGCWLKLVKLSLNRFSSCENITERPSQKNLSVYGGYFIKYPETVTICCLVETMVAYLLC